MLCLLGFAYFTRIVPSIEPGSELVTKLNSRSTVKLPLAVAKRPVPPVMVAFSIIKSTVGSSVGTP